MINRLNFEKFHDLLRGDKSLFKGWFPIEEDVTVYDENEDEAVDTVRKIGILYDCHLLYFDDPDGKFLELMDKEILEKKTTLKQ